VRRCSHEFAARRKTCVLTTMEHKSKTRPNLGSGTSRSAAVNHNNSQRTPGLFPAREADGSELSLLADLQASLALEVESWVDQLVRGTHCSSTYATAVVESLAYTIPYARLSQRERNAAMAGVVNRACEMYVTLLGCVLARAEDGFYGLEGSEAVAWLQELTNDAIDDLLPIEYPMLFPDLSREKVWELVSGRLEEEKTEP